MAEGALTRAGADAVREQLRSMDSVLAVLFPPEEDRLSAEEQALFDQRQQARASRDFARADEARTQLEALGIILEDTAKATRWRRRR
jgi:cysteinyl-tRNA synthetase